jgi:hypothetical protein
MVANCLFGGRNRLLIALVHGPALDTFCTYKSRRRQDAHMLAERRRADSELLRDQHAAHPILHEISVDLRAEMGTRVSQPLQDLKPPLVRQRLEYDHDVHG